MIKDSITCTDNTELRGNRWKYTVSIDQVVHKLIIKADRILNYEEAQYIFAGMIDAILKTEAKG